MCGIVYKESFNGQPVNQAVRQIFKKQRMRGIDGFGFYIPSMNKMAHNVREKRILDLLGKNEYQSDRILFHHRWPTSTSIAQNACHPFSTRRNASLFDKEYILVHNGHVSNATALRMKHDEMGIQYVSDQPDGSFNDSEALLYDLALYLEGKQDRMIAKGSIAFVIVSSDDRTWFGRNYGSPLKYDLNSRGLKISSEGAGEDVQADKLYEFLRDKKAFNVRDLEIPDNYYGGTYTSQNMYSDDNYAWAEDYDKRAGSTIADAMIGQMLLTSGKHHLDHIVEEGNELIRSFGESGAAIDYANLALDEVKSKIAEVEATAIKLGTATYFDEAFEELRIEKAHLINLLDFLWDIFLEATFPPVEEATA